LSFIKQVSAAKLTKKTAPLYYGAVFSHRFIALSLNRIIALSLHRPIPPSLARTKKD